MALPRCGGLVAAGGGRITGAHFGTYDYTALCGITASWQHMRHQVCDFAKHMMQVALAQSGVRLSDGATNIMPVPVYRAETPGRLTEPQRRANAEAIHRAWKTHYDDVMHSLVNGYYQGWDLHPAQLPTRYAALYTFFLTARPAATARLRNFVEKAAQATLVGDVFDDAATGQGLLNFFVRGLSSGALTLEEARETGLTVEELQGRSFLKILESKRRGVGYGAPPVVDPSAQPPRPRGGRSHGRAVGAHAPRLRPQPVHVTRTAVGGRLRAIPRSQLDDSESLVLVAERDGQVVGYLYAGIEPMNWKELRERAGFVHDILVTEESRGGGIAQALMNEAFAWMREQNVPRVLLWTAAPNDRARRLFERLGFRATMVEMTKELE